MQHGWKLFLLLMFLAVVAAFPASATSGPTRQTLTGVVSDAACGIQHTMMPGPADQCTRECVKRGAKYILVIADKIYVLNTTDKDILAVLDQQAGKQVTVTGMVNGVAVAVEKVVTAK